MIRRQSLINANGELNLAAFFFIFVSAPTILAAIYYSFIASDVFVSETQFSIYSNEPQVSSVDIGALSNLNAGNIQAEATSKLLILSEYIKSYDMLKLLDKELSLKKLYSSSNIDFLSRLDEDSSKKEFLEHYRKMIEVKINRDASIIHLKSRAYNSKNAKLITEKINQLSEEFINKMLARVKENQLVESEKFIEKAKNKVREAQASLSEFRIKNITIDPTEELNTKLEFIRSLRVKKAELLIEKNEKKALLSGNSTPIKTINNKIKNIDDLIEKTEKEILKFSSEGEDILRKYEMLQLNEGFAKEEYKLALVNLEETIKEQNRINKYIVEILKPTSPDIANEPEALIEILKTFFLSFMIIGVICLIISGARDHMIYR